MQNETKIIATLSRQLDKKEKQINDLRSQLEDALEENQELQQPILEFYHDL